MPEADGPPTQLAEDRIDAAVKKSNEIFAEQWADGVRIPSWFSFSNEGESANARI